MNVQRNNVKAACLPTLCALCALSIGCTTIHRVQRDGTRSVVLTQMSGSRFRLQASETVRISDYAAGPAPRKTSGTVETLRYPPVSARVDGDKETATVESPDGRLAASATLALREDRGRIIATYELKKRLPGGAMDSYKDSIAIE